MANHGWWGRAGRDLEEGLFGRAFTSYDRISAAWRRGAIYGAFSRIHSLRPVSRARRAASRSLENSFFAGIAKRVFSALPWLTLRSYGVFIMSFGIYTSIIYAVKSVATSLTADIDTLISGVMMVLLAVPLLLSKKTLAEAVASSAIFSYLAFDILGFRREDALSARYKRSRLDTSFLAGMIAGLATFYFEPGRVLAFISSAILLYVVVTKPETGVVLIYALFPFFGDETLSAFVAVVFAAYLIKLMCGRRTIRFDAVDTVMLIFYFLTVFASVINYGFGTGYGTAQRRAVFMLIYFLTTNLITNDAWRSRLMRTLIFGGSALAAVGAASVFVDRLRYFDGVGSSVIKWLVDFCFSASANAGASSYYLAMVLPLAVAFLLRSGMGGKRLNIIVLAAVIVTAAALTMSRGLWLGAASGLMLFLIACNVKFLLLPAALAVGLPAAMILLSDEGRAGLTAMLDISSPAAAWRVSVRETSCRMFADNIFGGIGSGRDVFSAVYGSYSHVGAEADNAQNLFLGIGVELGVFGLFTFLTASLLLLIKAFTGAKYGPDKDKRTCSRALACGIFAALVSGMSSYIWIDDRMFLLFFMFAGAVSAYNAGSAPRTDNEIKKDAVSVIETGRAASIDLGFRDAR